MHTELGRSQVEVQRCTLSSAGPRFQVPVHTELGSWQRAWRTAWRRVGKAEVEVEVDADMVEEKLEEEDEEEKDS